MNDADDKRNSADPTRKTQRGERLAAELRSNLKRRKDAVRARESGANPAVDTAKATDKVKKE